MDIKHPYHNSPLIPRHKLYVVVMWKGKIWVEHCAVFGLALSSGIQGLPANATVAILKSKGIRCVLKWVDDFAFIHVPTEPYSPDMVLSFHFDLDTILDITCPLGIPWHSIKTKAKTLHPSLNMLVSVGICVPTLCHFQKRSV